MEEEQILRGPDAALDIPNFQKNVSVIEILFKAMKDNEENIAQIEADTDSSIKFSELLKKGSTIAANLTNHGITERDTVVLCLDKSIQAYCMLVGVLFTGATAALWRTNNTKDEFLHQLKICHPKMVICSKAMYDLMSLSEDHHRPIFIFPDGASPDLEFDTLLKESDQDFEFYQVKDVENHFPLIIFTSGSTGLPKPVLVPNVSLHRYGYTFCDEQTRRFLVVAPFCWISSVITFISAVIKNYTMVLSHFDPVLHLQRAQHYQTDTWMITPPHMLALLNTPFLNYDLSSVKYVITGGFTLHMHLKTTFIEKMFHNNVFLCNLYGLSECGVFTTFKGMDPDFIKNTLSTGKLASGAQLKDHQMTHNYTYLDILEEYLPNLQTFQNNPESLLNDKLNFSPNCLINYPVAINGQIVGPGIEGELRVKTGSMMAKYVGYPEDTCQAFDSQGWFRTGDIGYFDENGFVYALGRLSDLIHYKNTRINMSPVEGLLLSHPAVCEAVIAAKPHSTDNEHPAAFIVIKPNIKVSAEEIQKFIDEQVDDDYKLRGGVHFVDFIPKLPNGKILKYILQRKFQD